jgi:hypothetical protein
MKRLYLLRHAKSSWKDTSLPDHDRPLAGRGRRAAKAIAGHLSEQGIEPELVLCSTARRARETLERIEAARATSAVRVEDDLYAASARPQLKGSTCASSPSATTSTPAPLPMGSMIEPVRPSTAASLVGLWPTASALPPSERRSSTRRSAAPRTAESSRTRSGSAVRSASRSPLPALW